MKLKTKQRQAVSKGTILVASGASGGHLFPAIAVAQELVLRGYDMRIVLGGAKFTDIVRAARLPFVLLPAAAFNDRGLVGKLIAAFHLMRGFFMAWQLVCRLKPIAVFGTGGYATVALVLAARLGGVPVIIHEQNVLPGRANRFLATWAKVVLLTFDKTRTYLPLLKAKVLVTGTPLRSEILAAAKPVAARNMKLRKGRGFHILVLGGSQGARILSDVVPEAVALLDAKERAQLRVVHQARPEDLQRVQARYMALGLAEVEVAPFFHDMPDRYAAAQMVIGRSGTGTLLECAVFGVPALYVPLELADGHQKLNAAVAEDAGAALIMPQTLFTPANVLVQIRALWQKPERCAAMAAAAVQLANTQATEAVVNAVIAAARHN